MKKIACFTFVMLTFLAGIAQNKKIDSLKSLLQREKTDTGRIAKTLKLGRVYDKNQNDSALIYYRNALQLSEKIGNVKNEIIVRSRMAGYLYYVKTDYPAALSLYLQNIKTEEQARDSSDYILYDTRGVLFIYENIGDFPKALEYVNKMRALVNSGIFKKDPNLATYKILVDYRLGVLYDKLNKPDSSKLYFLRTYNFGLTNHKELTFAALASCSLGDNYRKLKQQDSSLYYYRVCMPIALKLNRTDIYNNCLFALAEINLENKKTDSAFFYAIKSYKLTKKLGYNDVMIAVTSLLGDVYYAKKQPDSAYLYLRQSMDLKDSLFGADKISKVQNLGAKEALQKIEAEQARKEAVEAYKSQIKIYSLLAGLAVLIIFLFILYRNNMQRRDANKKIEKAYEELKSTQSQLIQSEKMASLGELTAGIAHEIQNPLNFVNNFSEVSVELLQELKEETQAGNNDDVIALANDLSRNLEKINHHGKRADAIVKGMLQHSQSGSGKKELTDLNALADEYLRLAYHGLRAKDKTFNAEMITHFDANIPKVNVIPQDIGRVMLNLFNNAFYAVNQKKKTADSGYKPTVEITTFAPPSGGWVAKVKDNGIGIPDAIKDKIMQPFFTTKPTGEGTGLGLSLTYDMVVKGHGGSIAVDTKEGEFTIFTINLPLT